MLRQLKWLVLVLLAIWSTFIPIAAVSDGEKLAAFKDGDGVVNVDDSNYAMVSQGTSNTFTVVYLTMSGVNSQGMECDLCQIFEGTLRQVMIQIYKQAPGANVVTYIADVAHNGKLVKDLNLTSVPHLLVYPPPKENQDFNWIESAFYQYELTESSATDVLKFGDFLAKILNIYVELEQPFDYTEFLQYFVICICFFTIIKKLIMPKITNRWKVLCMLISFGILLPSITGYKFTQIKGIPFIARNAEGQIMYFSGGMSWQFGIEIFTVSMLYIGLGLLCVALILLPQMGKDRDPRLIHSTSIILACMLFYLFSYYLSCYQIKSPDYAFAF